MIDQEINFDREQAFLLFTTFTGDVIRTAAALNVPAKAVLAVAESEGWLIKLADVIALSKSLKPGDLERAINRSLNFVAAHKMRLLLERVLRDLTQKTDAELAEITIETATDKLGGTRTKLSTRGFADLAASLEKMSAMSYAALSDNATDRARRDETGKDNVDIGSLHVAIAKAMSAAALGNSPRAALFDAQILQGQELAAKAIKPEHPNDDDNH